MSPILPITLLNHTISKTDNNDVSVQSMYVVLIFVENLHFPCFIHLPHELSIKYWFYPLCMLHVMSVILVVECLFMPTGESCLVRKQEEKTWFVSASLFLLSSTTWVVVLLPTWYNGPQKYLILFSLLICTSYSYIKTIKKF